MSGHTLHIARLAIRAGRRVLKTPSPVTLRAGHVYLVRGPSGAGKSTLARALLGLGDCVEPRLQTAGEVRLDLARPGGATQVPVLQGGAYNEASRAHMAFLPQSGSLGFVDELGLLANLTLFAGRDASSSPANLEALAQRFRVWPLPESLARASGGERMRLSAVRALLPRGRPARPPALLIADEPTTGLDPAAAHELAGALVEVAADSGAIVVVITHDPGPFIEPRNLPGAPEEPAIEVIETTPCDPESTSGDDLLTTAQRIATIPVETSPLPPQARLTRVARRVEPLGAFLLMPLAFLVGLLTLRPRTLSSGVRDLARTVANAGTWAFVAGAALLVSVTIGVFMFYLTPRRELIEPLILPDLLEGYGVALIAVVVPMFAAVFATVKNGAAAAARLSSSVRAGLLDTLALAGIRTEAYALVPAVLGHTLSMALTTALACGLGLVAGAMVFIASGSPMAPDQVAALMLNGLADQPAWFGWLFWKTLASGAVGGTVAALFGIQPAASEQDVAAAVHRTLLWSGFAVLAVQCIFVVAQFR